MLRKLPSLQLKTYIITEKFNVTPQFAEKRLLHYENQLLASKLQNQISQYCNFKN
ncbi:Phage-like element PBSX protein xkdA [Bacillus mycoides]|nr:Phage-like element PBSX protein xkdA [Bacillus mycoides]